SATAAALKHVVDREKALGADITAEPIKDKAGVAGKDVSVNGFTMHRTRLELRAGEDAPFKYMDMAVARVGGGTIVLAGECKWDKRDYWDQEFTALLGSVQATKAPAAKPEKEM